MAQRQQWVPVAKKPNISSVPAPNAPTPNSTAWLEKSFHIDFPTLNYRIKQRLYGCTFEAHSWTTNPSDVKNVTLQIMKNQNEAEKLKKVFENFNNLSIGKEFEIGSCDNATVLVSKTEFTGETLMNWIAKPKSGWEFDMAGAKCIGLGAETKSVLRAILRALQSIHIAGAYHGNIEAAVRISPQNEVCIAPSACDMTTDRRIEAGIRKDISDFEDIVRKVVQGHPISSPAVVPGHPIPSPAVVPRVVDLFYALGNRMRTVIPYGRLQKLRDFCFFIYNTPLLWDAKERILFKDLIWNMKGQNRNSFNSMLFSRGTMSMRGWQTRIPQDQSNPLYLVLHYNPQNHVYAAGTYPTVMYNFARGFIDYERNVLAHYQTSTQSAQFQKVNRTDIERQLYDILPESCSVTYYALIDSFQRLAGAGTFRDDLENTFKAEPAPCH